MAKKIFNRLEGIVDVTDQDSGIGKYKELMGPDNVRISIITKDGVEKIYDFGPFYGKGYDDIVHATQRTLVVISDEYTKSKYLSYATLSNYIRAIFSFWFPFLGIVATALARPLKIEDINKSLIGRYVISLREDGVVLLTQKQRYSSTKSVIVKMIGMNIIKEPRQALFPRNPFPNSNRTAKGESAFSPKEMGALTKSLANELREVKKKLGGYQSTI